MKFLQYCLLFLSISSFSQPLPERGIDIKHYTFELELNDSTDQLKGSATLKFTLTKSSSIISLDLMNTDASGKGMTVKSVTGNNQKLSFNHKNNKLEITFPSPLSQGDETQVNIDYSGIPDDGLIIGTNKYGDRTFFGDNWPNRAHHWLPVVDHPSDKATVDFIVTAPIHYEVVGNGMKLEESMIDKNRKLTHWHEGTPIGTKVMVIGVARFAVLYASKVGDISVEQWVYPQDRVNGFHDYAVAEKILRFYIEHIGPYSYEKLANVQSKTRYGGMENASNIFYFENSVNGKAEYDDLIAHEIAHQWFGNSASENDWYHIWLSEGFATYFAHIYNEYMYGLDQRASDMASERQEVIDYYKKSPLPVVFSTLPAKLLEILSVNSYQKGSWILHMLRVEIGDVAFWKGIRQYYKEYQNSNAATADFQRVMEQASGADLSKFFKQWLYTAGHPLLDVSWTYKPNEKSVEITVNQLQKDALFDFPLEIGVYSNERLPKIEKLKIDQKTKKFVIKTDQKPVKIELDPNVNLLYEGKINN
jgi:aminopeptidase N